MPVAWDRLADATTAAPQTLSIITLGHVHADDLNPLTPHFSRLEQLMLDIPPRDAISRHRAEFNRAVDAASNDWILIIREREVIDDPLAAEIAKAMGEPARGFRIRSVPYYAGKPLRIGEESGIRLFHRRYYMRYASKGEWDELLIQGTVVRLENVLRSVTFESVDAHRAWLEKNAVPHSGLRRALLFLRDARTLDRNTLRYIWTEAGFDQG
ncbi:MAG TPA: hypothetical protein VLV78_01680 [Thermoanaerobaculia bacterium]|nr:hypothetical protein [Thermoanaerobaculia bacterium]